MIIQSEIDVLRVWYLEEKRYEDDPRKAWKEAWSKLRFARKLNKLWRTIENA